MDRDLVAAFIDGAGDGRAGNLNIVGDVLHLDGWWQAAVRLADDAFIVRAEPPPQPSDVIDRLGGVLRERGLVEIPGEHPLVQAVTYAELSLVGVQWAVWAPDPERAEAALGQRAAPESEARDWEPGHAPMASSDAVAMGDLSAEFAASLLDGMPTSVVLGVGLDAGTVAGLEEALPDCRVEGRAFDQAVEACGVLVPHLVIVQASGQEGRQFLLEFRAEACGRHVPVAAVTDGALPKGADTTLDADSSPADWAPTLERMLP